MWIERIISKQIIDAASQFPAITVTGARQVGKTSLLLKIYPSYSFVTLDLPSAAELAERQPEEFIKRYPPPVVIDEVQYAPKIFRHLKLLIDRQRDLYGQFILTGSQKFGLMKGIADSLAGRCAIFELETLSFGEIQKARKTLDLDAMLRGGFPELQSRPELVRDIFYQSYVATYLERDVRSLLKVGGLRDFERFLKACAIRSGQVLNKSELARDVGISPTTANEWLSVLEASNQIVLLEPWFRNKTKSLIKSPKLYFADVGLMCYLTGINSVDELMRSPLLGAIWETFVFSEIRKIQSFEVGKWDAWFWRDLRGLEVDFLLHSGGRYRLIEAKFTESPEKRDAERMEAVMSILGAKNVDGLFIVSRVNQNYPITDRVQAIGLNDISSVLL